ncbi:unnamed protein product [Prorocentrum cordatum]|uniref:Uncharacterized protein n=1 Tax=Prorocentrum cordatum TaxID=2364126 RepID=A0ABN9VRB4_9DINO|nr:unnamed protein product [Polarella glacialis]
MSSLTCLLQRGPAQAARSMGGAERNRHARWATERLEDYRDRGEGRGVWSSTLQCAVAACAGSGALLGEVGGKMPVTIQRGKRAGRGRRPKGARAPGNTLPEPAQSPV